MIIWKGWGLLVLVFPLAIVICAQLAIEAVLGPGSFKANKEILWLGTGLVAGLATWIFGLRMNRAGNNHTLFFIPAQFWGAIWALMGAGIFFGVI